MGPNQRSGSTVVSGAARCQTRNTPFHRAGPKPQHCSRCEIRFSLFDAPPLESSAKFVPQIDTTTIISPVNVVQIKRMKGMATHHWLALLFLPYLCHSATIQRAPLPGGIPSGFSPSSNGPTADDDSTPSTASSSAWLEALAGNNTLEGDSENAVATLSDSRGGRIAFSVDGGGRGLNNCIPIYTSFGTQNGSTSMAEVHERFNRSDPEEVRRSLLEHLSKTHNLVNDTRTKSLQNSVEAGLQRRTPTGPAPPQASAFSRPSRLQHFRTLGRILGIDLVDGDMNFIYIKLVIEPAIYNVWSRIAPQLQMNLLLFDPSMADLLGYVLQVLHVMMRLLQLQYRIRLYLAVIYTTFYMFSQFWQFICETIAEVDDRGMNGQGGSPGFFNPPPQADMFGGLTGPGGSLDTPRLPIEWTQQRSLQNRTLIYGTGDRAMVLQLRPSYLTLERRLTEDAADEERTCSPGRSILGFPPEGGTRTRSNRAIPTLGSSTGSRKI